MKKYLWIVGIAMMVVSGIFVVATIAQSRAAGTSCTSSSGCSSPDICYFPDTDQSYCALPVGGSSSCSYGCCSNSDCGTGQTCYNNGTPFAYCGLPATTSNTNTGSASSATNTGSTNSGSSSTSGSSSGSTSSGTTSSGTTSSENTGSGTPAPASNSTLPSITSYQSSIDSALSQINQISKELANGDIGITQSTNNSSTPPATPQLLIDGTTDQSFSVGSSWTLNLASNEPNSPFTICAVISGVHTCTPDWGTTDANGNWTSSGSFPSSTIGSWTEWINFPNVATSNQIMFTVGGTGTTSGTGTSGTSTSSGSTASFPVTVLVTASALNVRSAANTSASLAGSETLYEGDTFTATNEVAGESVTEDGVTSDLWWVSSLGNYVWSGGTEVAGSGTGNSTGSGSGASSTGAKTVKATAPTGNPSIASVYWSSVAGGTLTVSGNFDPNSTLIVNGKTVPNNEIGYNGPPIDAQIPNPTYPFTVAVSDAEGTSESITMYGPPVLNAAQGYNPTTNKYEATDGVLNAGDTYLTLYGSFTYGQYSDGTPLDGGTDVVINGTSLPTDEAQLIADGYAPTTPSYITYASSTQINVFLGNLTVGTTSLNVTVTNSGGTSKTVKVAVNWQSFTTTFSSVSIPAVLAQLRSASNINAALAIVQNAGLTITGGANEDGDASYLATTPAGAFVAAMGNYDASTAVGAPIWNGYVYSYTNPDAATADNFTCSASVGEGTAAVITYPDGKVYGLAAEPNYSVSINCAQNGLGSCSTTQAAAAGAANAITAAGGPPVVNNSSVATISVTWVNAAIDGSTSVLANAFPVILEDGTAVCEINLSIPTIGSDEDYNANPKGYLQQILTHEMGHCMGLDHSLTEDSIMFKNVEPDGVFTSDDKAVLSALHSNSNIPVTCPSVKQLGWGCVDPMQILSYNENTNVYSCQSCPAGQIPITNAVGDQSCQTCPAGNLYQYAKQLTDANGNLTGGIVVQNACNNYCSPAIVGPGQFYNITGSDCVSSCGPNQVVGENGYQCQCVPGMTYDMSSKTCIQPQNNDGVSGSPVCDSGITAPDGQCYPTSNGTSAANICFQLSDGTTQCDCDAGYEQQGNSCVAIQSTPTGDTGNNDNAYSCDSGVCTDVGPGNGNYSDPLCGGYCNNDQ